MSETSIYLRPRPFQDESLGCSERENNLYHLERIKQISVLIGTVLTARHRFDTNVAFTEAFEDMYAFTAVNPGVPAKL